MSARASARLAILPAAILLAAVLGCRSDLAGWQAQLAASNAPRLAGVWNMRLRRDGDRAGSLGLTPVGQIALTLNSERVAPPAFGEPPMVVGTYDIDFAAVGLAAIRYEGFPGIVGQIRGDSVSLKLGSPSKLSVELSGVMRGDSIAGRWHAHSRAGPGGAGDFVLRRR